jgi:hypothetical protein
MKNMFGGEPVIHIFFHQLYIVNLHCSVEAGYFLQNFWQIPPPHFTEALQLNIVELNTNYNCPETV